MKQQLYYMVQKLPKKVPILRRNFCERWSRKKYSRKNNFSKKIIQQGVNIIELIFQNGLIQSKSEARRILKNNGIKTK